MDASYRLLGPLTALRGDAVIDLGPPKQRATLALLLLQRGRQVSTDRLVDALWGDEPPPSALASIQAYVSNLRRALRGSTGASSPIVRRAQGYVLEVPPDRVDLAVFGVELAAARAAAEAHEWSAALTHADAALALWRGELLEDLSDQGWVREEADAVDELRTECRETQITALLAAQRVAPALAAAVELRKAHPLRDRACWLAMLALHRAGRTSEALDAFTEHARRLDDELGLEPGAELRELQVAILRHEPALAAWPRPASWTGATEVHTPAFPELPHSEVEVRGSTLVGRARETRLLDELLADVGRGNARWLVLTGPAGIGKTRLAEELVARMRALGGRDAWSRCSEEDGAPAWWPIRQLVRALGEDPDALLVPPVDVDADAARFALYERVAERLQRTAATAPVAVVVDDAQWADPTSVRCLAYLVGALREVPVAFALTLRDGAADAAIAPLLQALARSDGHRQLAVGPLALADVRELANTIAGDPLSEREADELAQRTGGNPLFVSEYARLPTEARVQGDTPLAVRSVLGQRISRLEPEILQVLRAAAVIGDVVDLPALAATLGMEDDVVAEALDEAADEHVLVPSQDTAGYAFAHGLLRDELLAGLPAMRRRRLHARVAAALDGHDGDSVSRRAQHLVAALGVVEPDEVVDACVSAARVAEARWSSEVAAEWWAEALRVHDLQPGSDEDGHDAHGRRTGEPATGGPAGELAAGVTDGLRGRDLRDALLVAQVAALARAGRGQTVLDVLDAALLDAARAGRARTVGRLASSLLRSAGAWPWPTYGDDPGPLLERLQSLEPLVEDDPVAHVSLLAAVAIGRCYDPDPTVPERLSARALALADALGDEDAVADALLGRLLTYSGVAAYAEEIVELAARLVGLSHREARVDAAIARAVGSMAHLSLGDVAAAAEDVRLAVAETDVLQLPVIRVQLRWMEGTLATWRGDFDDAQRHYEIGTRVHLQTELYYAGSAALAKLSLRREREGLAGADPTGTFEWEPWDAAIAAARGDLTTAEHRLTEWLDAQTSWIWITLGHVTLLADTVVEARLTDLAPRLYALLEPYAGRIAVVGHIGVINTIDYARGRLLALMGETRAARVVLERALEQARALGGEPTAARCVRALAALGAGS
ncbi:SARP family transcriptional regulator [Solirubrobacter pauli]|uniref:SARP family transcriptional regulator n=1 Tax=Solirubrobacter pauli TaxID=166793 RepID=A0A660L8X2_9ACTN|nr:BTAD domain-containing putative transcriptional regulator [Solirubrobacter pauli]RKQ90353.1 SARP family transcriptional regulator [Solirubrobacter pauli]